jgi:hypothetical protein
MRSLTGCLDAFDLELDPVALFKKMILYVTAIGVKAAIAQMFGETRCLQTQLFRPIVNPTAN